MSKAAELMSKLTGGKVALVDSYEQGTRIKAFTPGDKELGKGLCEGQCLHWLRRVLQGGKAEYRISKLDADGSERSPDQLLSKAKQQHAGGVVVQRMLADDVRQAVVAHTAKQVADRLNALIAKGQLTAPEAQALMNKYGEADFYKTDWNKLAAMLDAKVKGTVLARKRGFSGIVCISAKTRGPMPLAGLVRDLESQGLFQAGRGALISGGVNGGGHAVAAYVRSGGEMYLFDPNYGIFRCSNAGGLREAIVTLIGKIWPELQKWRLDNEYGYAVFEAKESEADVRPGQHAVSFKHGESSTFLANKADLRLR
jgi:Yersinia/Haemophilus virulence surface antigen